MRAHKWAVRGLVFSALIGMAGAALVYQHWTDPVTVRQQVIAALERQFPGADVTLEAARLRLLGGILLTELRVLRHDDLTRTDLTYIPSAIIYHDKEQLLDGVLALRKVELHRPRFRVIREADGRWNFTGLTRPGDGDALLPTVVIHEGTLFFEDRLADTCMPPLEISGVTLTLINDPLPVVKLEGSGVSPTLGNVELRGSWQRATGDMTLAVKVAGAQLTSSLVERMLRCASKEELKDFEAKGLADFQLDLDCRVGEAAPRKYDLRCQIRQGFCRHPALPLPLDRITLEARCSDGHLEITRASAVSGATKLTAHGKTRLRDWRDELEASLSVENLHVNKHLCSRLPEEVQPLHKLFRPEGPVNVELDMQRRNGEWTKKRCLLKPQNLEVCFLHFPYPVTGVTGTLDADLLSSTVKVNLTSTTAPITLNGTWQGSGDGAQADLHLRANQIPLDGKLLQALPPAQQELVGAFHLKGWGDLQAHISRTAGSKDFDNTYQVRLIDCAVKWDHFRYPLDNVSGTVNIYPHYCEFQDLRGQHNGGTVTVSGKTMTLSDGGESGSTRLLLDIAGHDVRIDADLRKALTAMPNLGKAWDAMGPSGQLSFHARVDQAPGRPQDLEIAVQVLGCRLEPAFFRYPLTDLSGFFRYHHNRLEMQNVQAKHQHTRLAIGKATVDVSPQGGFYANFHDLEGNPVFPDDGLIDALPTSMQRVFNSLNLKDPIAVQTQLIVAQPDEPGSRPDIYWKGRGWVTNATMQAGVALENVSGVIGCVGRHNGEQLLGLNGNIVVSRATVFRQPLENVHCNLTIKKETPDVMVLNLKAPLFGGDISGEARLDLNSTLRYEMNLTAAQVDLNQFGQHNLKDRTNLKGLASARLHLTGQGDSLSSLLGNGTIHIPRGKLYNLPFLLDLLKFLGLRWPDRTAFEEAFASYSIQGDRLIINRLDLWGSAISLTGQGAVNLDGTDLKLDFYPTWARVEQLLPAVLKDVTPAVSKSLMKIEVRGRISDNAEDLKFHKRPVPVLVDPLVEIRELLTGVPKNSPK